MRQLDSSEFHRSLWEPNHQGLPHPPSAHTPFTVRSTPSGRKRKQMMSFLRTTALAVLFEVMSHKEVGSLQGRCLAPLFCSGAVIRLRCCLSNCIWCGLHSVLSMSLMMTFYDDRLFFFFFSREDWKSAFFDTWPDLTQLNADCCITTVRPVTGIEEEVCLLRWNTVDLCRSVNVFYQRWVWWSHDDPQAVSSHLHHK